MVRAANTGISAVIDPYGRTLSSLPLNGEGIMDAGLPQSLPPTVFCRLRRINLFHRAFTSIRRELHLMIAQHDEGYGSNSRYMGGSLLVLAITCLQADNYYTNLSR